MKSRVRINPVFLVCYLLLLFPNILFADWYWRNPLPQGAWLAAVACGSGTCVTVGDNGAAVASADGGATWTPYNLNAPYYTTFTAAAFGNGTYVAGDGGLLYTSKDNGKTWNNTAGPWSTWNGSGIAYGNGRFVAGGYAGTIYTSTDGMTWSSNSSGTNSVIGISYGNGTFVAFGYGGVVYTSTDGVIWTSRSSGITNDYAVGVTFGNGAFTALTSGGKIVTSPDGKSWTSAASLSRISGAYFSGIAYGNGTLVAVGDRGMGFSSPDGGKTWTALATTVIDLSLNSLRGVTYDGNAFWIVGESGVIIGSTDSGKSWNQKGGSTFAPWNSSLRTVTFGNSAFVGAGFTGNLFTGSKSALMVKSTDGGLTWTSKILNPASSTGLYGSTFGNGTFVLVGANGQIYISTDNGTTWSAKTSGTTNQLNAAAFDPGDGSFWAVGSSNTIIRSTDGGAGWKNPLSISSAPAEAGEQASAVPNIWQDTCNLEYRDKTLQLPVKRVVVVGDGGSITLLTQNSSSGGFSSQSVLSGTTENLTSVDSNSAYGSEILVAVGGCTVLVSADGGQIWKNYTIANCDSSNALIKVKYNRSNTYMPPFGLTPATSYFFTITDNTGHIHDLKIDVTNGLTSGVSLDGPVLPSLSATQSGLSLTPADPLLTNSTNNHNPLFGLANGNATIVAVGYEATILQSDVLCYFTITTPNNTVSISGGTGSVNFTATAGSCVWNATSDSAWLSITSNANGAGSATINYSASANAGTAPRSGTIIIGDATYTVTQAGVPSITWRHPGDGRVYGMTTNGSTITGGAQFYQEANAAWSIVGQGDFDGDGIRDFVWWNSSTGQIYLMLMASPTVVKSGAIVYTEPNTSWRIVATGDLNGDGRSDLIWWNNSTGQVYAMLLNGTAVAGGGLIYTEPNTNWKIVAAADFNGDGKVELLWWNSSTGQTAIGQTNGTSASSANLIWTEPNTDWRIAGAGDLDGDGKADIIWHNRTTGQVYGMQTNGSSVTNGAMMYTEPNTQWEIVSVGNYNGDSKPDLL
ncbi:MAG: FG-GAP-like repeat-containing protein [Desulfuromonadales bacterium]